MSTTLADEFTGVFRAEHREVRDALLGLLDAFETRDSNRIAALLSRTASLTGPHFRYEEEALYPALLGIFDPAYVEHLLGDHDGAIAGARRLVALAETSESLTDAEVSEAVRTIRAILPHVSDCDGLSIMVEVLPEEDVRAIFAARKRAGAAGLDLLTWADEARARTAETAAG